MRNALVLVCALLVVAQADEPKPAPADLVLRQIEKWPVGELFALRAGIDQLLLKRLLTPAEDYRRAFAHDRTINVARILERGLLQGVPEPRGGGAYFSFETRSHSYDKKPDIELQNGYFKSGFAGGDIGLVVPIDVKSVIDATLEHQPDAFKLDPPQFCKHARSARERATAETGKVYMIRSIRWRQADLVAAFEVLQRDEYGLTFAWKLLEKQAVGERP
ncbi:MAG: hypothetical protein ACYTHK_11310 [Planctomycetota bacterium]